MNSHHAVAELAGDVVRGQSVDRLSVAFLTSHPTQNAAPFFRHIAADPSIDLTVVYCSKQGLVESFDEGFGLAFKWDIPLLDGYKSVFIRNVSWSTSISGFSGVVNPGVAALILKRRFDAIVIGGWGYATCWIAFAAAWLSRTPWFLYGDSDLTAEARSDTPRWIKRAKRPILKGLFRRTAGFLVTGVFNRDYYLAYGALPDRLFHCPYTIDNEFFRIHAERARGRRHALRESLGLDVDLPVMLFVGKLYEGKRPFDLLLGAERLLREHRASVVFIGDGVQRRTLENYVNAHQLPNVVFAGFRNQSDMPAFYAMGDVLVVPSWREHRATVVNEAMACGLPIVISDGVGVWGDGDIVRDGENGFVYPAGDTARLAQILAELVDNPARLMEMGQRSLGIISAWNFDAGLRGLKEAVDAVRIGSGAALAG